VIAVLIGVARLRRTQTAPPMVLRTELHAAAELNNSAR